MKKIVALLLVLTFVFSFAACNSNETAYELYSKASKALAETKNVELNLSMETKSTIGTQLQENVIGYTVKQSGDNFAFVMNPDTKFAPFNSISYVDGVLYLDSNDGKFKQTTTLEELKDEFKDLLPDTEDMLVLPTLTEEKLKDIQLEKNDGLRSFSIKLDKTEASSILGSLGDGDIESTFGADADFDITLNISFNDKGILEEFTFNIKMGATFMEQELSLEFNIKADFVDFGSTPTVTAPADAADYVEQ